MNATRKCSISVFLVLILTAGLLPQTTAEEFEWTQAGAAKIDITPEEPVRLTGYGERKVEFEGIEQRIWARAIAFGSDTNTCILIAVENCGITADIVSEVASRVKKQIGVPRERLVICSTHTHTAPAVLRFAPTILTDLTPEQSARIEKYTAWVTERITAAALAAAAARKPARLSWSEGSAAFAANRRVLKNGLWTGFGINPDGPVQHKLPVLRATDKQGKLIAAVANYACHCTTLGGGFNKVCGDWAGYASEFVEAEVTGSTALITIGCGADTNPNPRGKLEMAKEHGRVLANEVQRQLQEPGRPLPVKIDARFSETRLPLSAAPSKEQFRTIADDTKQRDASRRHAREWLARFEKGEKAPDHVVLPLANWSFGTALNMLFIGGEVVIDYDTLVRERFDSSRMWISAYANDVPCYIPSQRILKEGGYEAQFSMIYYGKPAPFAPEVESTLLDAIKDVVPKEFARPAPKEEAAPKGADAGPGTRPALTPEQGLKSLRVKAGFRVELAAAEPLVESPVAFDWGPDGRLWVVEMRDYPIGMDGKGSPGGRIKVLTDTDGDGRYDKAAIFLDALPCPTAVKVWRDGAIVAAAPEIFFAKDTDGDGKADKRETLYSGFTQGNQQHLVNSLFFRLDGGLQVANGDSGGMIKSARTGQVVDIRGRDLSIYPDSGTHVAQSGPTQFGTCRDDWDNWFGGNNSYPMWHYALEDVYLRRNPHAASPNPRIQVSVDPGPSRVYPSSETTTRFNDHDKANRFTSACSPVIYRDSFLSGLSGNAFICEPVHNLVHREIVSAKGITFSSRRAADEEQSEFLSSTDNWFRPVWIRTGPDGALWIADMYRYVIEHPQWIPRGWQRQLNIRAGEDRGRIYRVVPAAGGKPVPRLDNLDTAALVQRLNDSNGTVRDLAHQVLVWKNDPAAVVPLRELARSAATPQARLHAIYVLNAIGALDKASLIPALSDAHAGVRRHAIRLSERALKDGDTEVLRTAIALEKDPDPQVQMQLACSLGMSAHADAGKALLRLAVLHASDEYLFAAVASSMLPHLQTMVEDLSAQPALLKGQPALAVQLLKMAVAEDRAESLAQLLKAATAEQDNAPWRFTLLSAFLDTLQSRGTSWSAYLQRSEVLQKCKSSFAVALESARKVVADNAAPLEGRLGAVRLLGRDAAGAEMDLKILAEQLSPLTPPELQREAVAALGRIRDPRASEAMLSGWKNHGPALRQTVLDTLLSRQDSTLILLERMKKMPALVTAMDASRRQRLLKHKEEAIRTRAAEVLVEDLDSDRAKVVAKHDAVLRMYGDAQRGKAVFATVCAACHQLEGAGNAIGPDLTALNDKSPAAMLVAILDPNRAVEDRFVQYLATMKDGSTLAGKIESETSTSVTLVGVDAVKRQLLRSELASIRSTGLSLMPEGLEATLDDQKLADVIAYVARAGSPPKQIAGNEPKLIEPAGDGTLLLPAQSAEIYGGRLTFETPFQNLGFWERSDDQARWAIRVDVPGRYLVEIDYACGNTAANSFAIQADRSELKAVVTPTGAWEKFQTRAVGFVDLRKGHHRLSVRADGKLSGSLMDLRSVRLSLPRTPAAAQTVSAGADGSISLAAAAGRGVGPSIKYMPEWHAYGWFTAKDQVEWDVQVEKAGVYEVILDWSVSDADAGKPFSFEIAGARVSGKVKSTGSWELFQQAPVGRVELKSGKHTAKFAPAENFEKGALLDLREVRLVPAR